MDVTAKQDMWDFPIESIKQLQQLEKRLKMEPGAMNAVVRNLVFKFRCLKPCLLNSGTDWRV